MITQKQEIQINFKEYLVWFQQDEGFNTLRNQALPARTPIKNVNYI